MPKRTLLSHLLPVFFLQVALSQSPANVSGTGSLLNPAGDTVRTGVLLTCRGNKMPISASIFKNTTPLFRPPVIKTERNNRRMAGIPQRRAVPDRLQVTTPGEAGIPLPDTFPAIGQVTPAKSPVPVPALPPKKRDATGFGLYYLDVEHGLSDSDIYSVIQDSRGHLWMATVGKGVCRYDGQYFYHYTTQQGMPGNVVRSIMEDNRGHIWMGLVDGFCRFDGKTFTFYDLTPGRKIGWSPTPILEDSKGFLWLGDQLGITRYDGQNFIRFTENHGLGPLHCRALTEDRTGHIWIGRSPGGLLRYDGKSFTHYGAAEGLPNLLITSLMEDNDEKLWVGSHGAGVSSFDGRFFSTYGTAEGLSHNDVSSILQDRHGDLWFGTWGGGVNRLSDGAGGASFSHFTPSEGLSNFELWSMTMDSEGNLWFAMDGGGLGLYRRSGFVHLSDREGLGQYTITSIVEDEKGQIWFGTEGNGLVKYADRQFTHYTAREGLRIKEVGSLGVAADGQIWIGGDRDGKLELSKFDGNAFQDVDRAALLQENYRAMSRYLHRDRQGGLWFSGGGAMVRLKGEELIHYGSDSGLSGYRVRSMTEDRQGRFWLATANGGVTMLHGDSVVHYTIDQGLISNNIISIQADSAGNIWLGTALNGLNRLTLDPADYSISILTFQEADGLSSNEISSILEDRQQNIWISTARGIDLLKPGRDNDQYDIFSFGQEDGLERVNFIRNSACLDQHNRIWWGAIDGVTVLDLNTFELPVNPPSIHLQSIEVNQTFIDFHQLSDSAYRVQLPFGQTLSESFDSATLFYNYPVALSLPARLNHLTFHFPAVDWANPQHLQYAYQMSGIDDHWSPLSPDSKADYRNLPPGKYTFRAKAIGAAQQWSNTFAYQFRVLPPWWQSTWAISTYLLLLLLSMWSLLRWRTASLRRRQKALEQTVAHRTADLSTERQRSDDLLLNILPAKVASELKRSGHTPPEFFEDVSILFADFKGYTNIVASIPGKLLVAELDDIFKNYDDIMEAFELEKIHTVGDAYIAAGGLPITDSQHATKCVRASQEIINFLNRRNETSAVKWQVRIGIHSGPITAGVIGKKKFSYDIFGDTVNIAARVESAGEAGRINVSAYTYNLIKEEFACTYRGKINAKGKGELDMYFVENT